MIDKMKTCFGNFNPEMLRETDFKGALGCFLMLTWSLVMTGRMAYLGTLYTSALTGVVVQYALLQARACYSTDCSDEDEGPCELGSTEFECDPMECPGVMKRGIKDSCCDPCCENVKPLVSGYIRDEVIDRITGPQMRCVTETEPSDPKVPWKPPGLAAVAAAMAFCSLPLSVCAIAAQFLLQTISPLLAPLPAAWCTLLAVCALLPPERRQIDRALVVVPSGAIFTWLTLIYII